MTTPERPVGAVAVIGGVDEPGLDRCLALIQDLASVSTHVRATLRDLPADVGAVFLPHALPEHNADTRVPVVTGRDTAAIALSAAVLTTLTRAGRRPRTSRVLIAGADTTPLLSPLLAAAGVCDITIWSMKDAARFPLRRLTADVHVVVDLLDITAQAGIDAPDATPAVVTPHGHDAVLAVPGLLRALLRTPDARLDVSVCHACVLALVMATPLGERLPIGPDQALTDQIADAATQQMRRPYDFGSSRPAG